MDEFHAIGRDKPERAEGHWLVLAFPGNPAIRFDARKLDRIFAQGDDLFLAVDKVRIVLRISCGAETARRIAEALAPYTRSAQITTLEAYEEARLRLEVLHGNLKEPIAPALYFGDDGVRAIGDQLHVGKYCFEIPSVERYALLAAELPHPDGRLHAALASLAVADARRRDDSDVLASRIADYESRVIVDSRECEQTSDRGGPSRR